MAISLEELRRQVNEQSGRASKQTGQQDKMTLAQLREQTGYRPETETAEDNTSADFEIKDSLPEKEKTEKEVVLPTINRTDSYETKVAKARDIAGIEERPAVKPEDLPDYIKYQGINNLQNAQQAADRVWNVVGSAVTGAAGGIITASEAAVQDISGDRGVAMKRLLEENRDASLGIKAGENMQGLVNELQTARTNEKLDTDTAGTKLLEKADEMTTKAVQDMTPAGQFMTQTIISVLENALMTPLALINPLLSTGAFAASAVGRSTYNSAMEGKSLSEAFSRGVIDGTIEMATEKIGVDAWLDMITGKGGSVIKNLLKQSGSEAGEEALSYLAGWLMDVAQQEPDAAFSGQELLMSALGGGLSGLIFGGGTLATVGKDNYLKAANGETETVDETAKEKQRAVENLQIVPQLEKNGIDTGNAVQELTETITGEKTAPQADPKVVEKENARVAAIEEAAQLGTATAEDVQKVKAAAAENIRRSENKEVFRARHGDNTVRMAEELAKDKGYKVVWENDTDPNAPNAYIEGNKIYLNAASDNPAFAVAVHEVGHGLKSNTTQWNKFEKSMLQLIASSTELTKFADAVTARYTENPDSAAYKSLMTDGALDQSKLNEEIVLKTVEQYLPMIAANEESLMAEIKKDRSLIDGLLDIIRGIKNNLKIRLAKSEKAMLDEAERNLVNLLRSESSESRNKRYSYGGVRADNTPDTFILADRMRDYNYSDEEIRKATGWFKGADGKWRFEIDDSKMKIDLSGKLHRNPDIKRRQELEYKIYFGDGGTEADMAELVQLNNTLKGVNKQPKRLGDMVEHRRLFEHYPDLKDVWVVFKKDMGNSSGRFDGEEIYLSEELKSKPEQLKKTLIHEIQHWIQHYEGFAGGANSRYWEGKERFADEQRAKRGLKKQEEKYRKKYAEWPEGFQKIADELYANESWLDSADETRYQELIDRAEEKYQDEIEEYFDLSWDLFKEHNYLKNINSDDYESIYRAYDNYRRTAGEQEARDVEKRLNYTAERRRAEVPFTGDEKTVFVDDFTFSADEAPKDDFESQVDRYKNGEFKQGEFFSFGNTSARLKAVGVTDLPIYMTQETIQKMLRDPKIGKSGHKLSYDQIKTIPKYLEHPLIVIESDADSIYNKNIKAKVIVTKEKILNDNIIIALHENRRHGFSVAHLITSAYARKNFKWWIGDQFQYGNVIGWHKKEATRMLRSIGVQFPSENTIFDFDNMIPQTTENNNGKKQSGDGGRFSLKIQNVDDHKQKQLKIVQATNPMHDDYHTGIKSVDDIHTADEVFNEDEFIGTPDWTYEDAQTALEKGKITVYSSYAINDGIFVTPSRMMAKDYAGSGRVYSKEVPLDAVAWIDSEEGQYAPVSEETRYSVPVYQYDGETAKSRGIRRQAVNELADKLGGMFGITDKASREGMRRAADKIADQVEKFGFITKANMDNFFDAAYQAARFTDEKADYAPLKRRIREAGIEPLGGREYLDFLQKYKGKIKFKRGGLPIDTLYQELNENYPEYFPDDISNPYEQMEKLGEVYDSLQRLEMSADEYFGDYAQEFRAESYDRYAREVDLFVERINSVSRYKKANTERKAQKDRAAGQPPKTYTLDAVQKAHKDAERISKEISKVMKDTPLTEEDQNLLDDLLKIKSQTVLQNTLKDMQENNPNAKAIYKLFNLKQELAKVKEPVREYARANKDKNRGVFMELLTTSKSWKEKHRLGGLRYKAETFERIIDDIVTDKKAAEKLKDMLPRSIHKHVAEGNRYKNELRDRVRRLNLDTKKLYDVEFENNNNQLVTGQVTESGLVQIYGEGLIGKEYLDKIGADVEKITAAATEFRKIYNEMLEKINEAYVRNGYKPVEYRGDYFPHFMEDGTDTLLNKMTSWFGIDAESKIPSGWNRALAKLTIKSYTDTGMLPTESAGKTYRNKPGRRWNPHALQRVGENTVYDALKGFDNYLETATDVIFLTDDIQNLRSFEDAIRYKFSDKGIQEELDAIDEMEELSPQEKWNRKREIYEDKNRNKYLNNFVSWLHNYTNLLAGKKDFADRQWEENLGRGIYQLSKDLESRVAANMVAGNISSALTNFIPIAQMTTQVKEKYILAAMGDTVKNMKSDDGFAFQSDFLTNRFGSERLVDDSLAAKLQKTKFIGDVLGIMETVDRFTSNVVVRAKYMQNINEGMTHEIAIKDADEFAAGLMADRSKGALPTIFETKNPVTKALTMFQVEQNNQLQYLLKDLPRSLGEKDEIGKLLMMALVKYSLYSWMYNWMYEQIAGRKPAFSPIDLMADTGKDFYRVYKGDMKASEAVTNTVVNVAEELPFAAAPLAMSGLSDDAGRLPISGALPDFANVLKLFDSEISVEKKKSILYKEMSKPMYYLLFSVGGGQVKKTGEAMHQMIANDGVSYYTNNNGSKNVQFAVDTKNPLKWAQSAAFGRWSTKEAREYVDGGFNYLNKVENGMFDYLTGLGISSKDAYEQVAGAKKKADADGNGYLKTEEVKRYLDSTGMSRADKANLFSIMLPNVKNNPYK